MYNAKLLLLTTLASIMLEENVRIRLLINLISLVYMGGRKNQTYAIDHCIIKYESEFENINYFHADIFLF